VKDEISLQFEEVNKTQLYFAKKNLRRILRLVNKQIRYTASRQVEVELVLHYCLLLTGSGIEIKKSPVIWNVLKTQIKKLEKALSGLHEDLQYDYQKQMKALAVWR
jgi:transcriptional regulatory protein LevR